MFEKIKERCSPKGSFKAHVLILVVGTTIAQAMPIIVSPVLARIYSPEDFGILGLFMSIAGILSAGATGGYEQAIMVVKDDVKSANIVALSLAIACFQALFFFIFLCLFKKQIVSFVNNEKVIPWLYYVPVLLFLAGCYQAFSYWANRKHEYSRLAISRIFQSLLTVLSNVSMGLLGWGASGLIIGGLVGQGVSTCVLGMQHKKDYLLHKHDITISSMKEQAKENSAFPRYCLPQSFLDGVRDNSMIFIISFFFNMSAIGYFNFASRILRTPLNIIGSSLGQVFFQRSTQLHHSGESIWPLLKKLLFKLAGLSLFIGCIIFFLGPQLFAFFFGAQWVTAGQYAQILTPWFMINFIGSSISQVPIILGKQKQFMWFSIIFNVLVPISFLVAAWWTKNMKATLIYVSVTACILLTLLILWVMQITIEDSNDKIAAVPLQS